MQNKQNDEVDVHFENNLHFGTYSDDPEADKLIKILSPIAYQFDFSGGVDYRLVNDNGEDRHALIIGWNSRTWFYRFGDNSSIECLLAEAMLLIVSKTHYGGVTLSDLDIKKIDALWGVACR